MRPQHSVLHIKITCISDFFPRWWVDTLPDILTCHSDSCTYKTEKWNYTAETLEIGTNTEKSQKASRSQGSALHVFYLHICCFVHSLISYHRVLLGHIYLLKCTYAIRIVIPYIILSISTILKYCFQVDLK